MKVPRVPYICLRQFDDFVFDSSRHWPHLADYALDWLVHGEGMKVCGYDFSIFLSTMLLAATRLINRDLHESDEPESQWFRTKDNPAPTEIFDEECDYCRHILDPQLFQAMTGDPEWFKRAFGL